MQVIKGTEYRLGALADECCLGGPMNSHKVKVYLCISRDGAVAGYVGVVCGEFGPVCRTVSVAARRANNCYESKIRQYRATYDWKFDDYLTGGRQR